MKIGILTFHNAYNYGAVLQAYATQEIVKSYGHEVEIINYHNKVVDRFYKIRIPRRRFYLIPLTLVQIFFLKKRKQSYHRFISKHLNLMKKAFDTAENASLEGFDVILIGSDQLWNKNITGGWDRMYWGDFKTSLNARKVAWSVCMNCTEVNEKDVCFIKKHLEDFDLVSVRENSLKLFLSKITSKKIYQTLDPTLVLPSIKWEELCHDVKEKDYIAVYAVQDEEKTIAFARNIAKILGKKLVIIRGYSNWKITGGNKEYAGPDDFLSYIRHADFVVTTSFHGTVFSIIYQKQFVCPIFRDNVRVESLLESLRITERRINTIDEYNNLQKIDYTRVNGDLNSLQEETLNVWKSIL